MVCVKTKMPNYLESAADVDFILKTASKFQTKIIRDKFRIHVGNSTDADHLPMIFSYFGKFVGYEVLTNEVAIGILVLLIKFFQR